MDKRYCSQCGAQLGEGTGFCPQCGQQQAGMIQQPSAAAPAPDYSAPFMQQPFSAYGMPVQGNTGSVPAKRKKVIKAAAIALAAVVIVGVLGVLLATLGGRPSGKYVPADPTVSGIWFDSLRFEGGTVYVEAAGSSIGLDYKIKDGMLVFKTNLNINGEPVPKSMLFTKLKDGTIWLDGVQYIHVN